MVFAMADDPVQGAVRLKYENIARHYKPEGVGFTTFGEPSTYQAAAHGRARKLLRISEIPADLESVPRARMPRRFVGMVSIVCDPLYCTVKEKIVIKADECVLTGFQRI
jgi:hypothetical protein